MHCKYLLQRICVLSRGVSSLENVSTEISCQHHLPERPGPHASVPEGQPSCVPFPLCRAVTLLSAAVPVPAWLAPSDR